MNPGRPKRCAGRAPLCVMLALLAWGLGATIARAESSPRQHLSLDNHWRFFQGDPSDAAKPEFEDSTWRSVVLPHDWSIEGQFDPKAPSGGAGGFLPTGVGWYRRKFVAANDWRDRRATVVFEGVYMNADVFLNGEKLASHPYGYTSFLVPLTDHLKFGQTNLLAVRVDNSHQNNTRWYSGSGIYRHVWLDIDQQIHLASDMGRGVYFTTAAASAEKATVHAQTSVKNDSGAKTSIKVQTVLIAPDGEPAGQSDSTADVEAGASAVFNDDISVSPPLLWSPTTPQLYQAVTLVLADGHPVDEQETAVGIRMLRWSAADGMQINGRTVKLCGGCMHHDNGCLGSAAFDRAEERRVELLKAAGFNAVRTSHNPPSPAFLNACDRLGMLVMDESFDCWEVGKTRFDYNVAFDQWWQRDLDSMVLRDRNHPSIILWSVGNEIPERFKPRGVELGKALVARVHGLDSTRPVTAAICGVPAKPAPWSDSDAAFSVYDVAGYNYNLEHQAEDHVRNPQRIMVAAESFPHAAVEYFKYVHDSPYVVGEFVWTAMDYIGESGLGRWQFATPEPAGTHAKATLPPCHGSTCGDIDSCGFRRYQSHYRNILWERGEKLYMAVEVPTPVGKKLNVSGWGVVPAEASWTWPGWEGKPMRVDVFSRYEHIRLMLDDKVIGEKTITAADNCKAVFPVPYAPGLLRAVALQDGEPVAESRIETVSAAAKVRLTADRNVIDADGEDLCFVTVEVTDAQNRVRPDAQQKVKFTLSGEGTLAGVGNADMQSLEPYQANERSVFNGTALAVIRAPALAGTIRLHAEADGLDPAEIEIQAKATPAKESVP